MKIGILVTGIVLIMGALIAGAVSPDTEDAFEIVTTGTSIGEEDNIRNFDDPNAEFKIEDPDGEAITSIKGIKEGGRVTLDEKGNVAEFHGTIGDEDSTLKINGDEFSVPAGTTVDYKDGVATFSGKEGDDLTYTEGGQDVREGEYPDFHTIKLGKGDLFIEKDEGGSIISSEGSFEIYDGALRDNINVKRVGEMGSKAIVKTDKNGILTSIENAELEFKAQGITVLGGEEETRVYFQSNPSAGSKDQSRDCVEQGSFLCINRREGEAKLAFGSYNKNIGPSVEMRGENIFFEGNEESDYVRFSSGSSGSALGRGSSKLTLEQGRVTVDGTAKIMNGGNSITVNEKGDGHILSGRIHGSKDSSMPMNVYTKEDGGLGKYMAKVKDSGTVDIDGDRFGVRRTIYEPFYKLHKGGTYPEITLAEDMVRENIVEEVGEYSDEEVGRTASGRMMFDGDLHGENVEGFTLTDGVNTVAMSKLWRPNMVTGTLPAVDAINMCEGFGVKGCGPDSNLNKDMEELYTRVQAGASAYAVFTTESGESWEFGDPSLAP
jgi:hypothetical protein